MRILEIISVTVLALTVAAVSFRYRPNWKLALFGGLATVLVFSMHTLLEGVRWQMVPTYLLLAFTMVVLCVRSLRPAITRLDLEKRGVVRKFTSGSLRYGLLPACFLFVLVPPIFFPVFNLPEPPAWQQIGVTDVVVEFEDRAETLTEDASDRREMLVRAWYPAQVARGSEPEPYLTALEAEMVTKAMRVSMPVPTYINSHLPLVQTHSHRDAGLQPGTNRFPVLVFNHGYGSYVSQNVALMEYFASQGYVVFSLSHPYDGSVVLPDGRSVLPGEHYRRWSQEMTALKQTLVDMNRFAKTSDVEARQTIFQQMRRQSVRDGEAKVGPGASWEVWLEDQRRFFDVLREMDSGQRQTPFEGRLDLDRIGLIGMSFGGITAAEVCHVHAGCRAVINLDGAHLLAPESALLDREISKPLLMLYASKTTTAPRKNAKNPGDFRAFNDFYYEPIERRGLNRDVIRLRIEGTSHIDLSDASLMSRFIPGMSSDIGGERVQSILCQYSRAFLDHYVKGTETRSPLLDEPADEYPEISHQTFGRGFEGR